jgi:uncharacterized protein YjbI with pentapeptide repeats
VADEETATIPLRFAGKRVVIADSRQVMRDDLETFLRAEGAEIVASVTPETDIVVQHRDKPSTHEKRADELNKSGKAKISVVREEDLRLSIAPTRDETLAMLRGDDDARRRWTRLMPMRGHEIDLSGESFADRDLRGLFGLRSTKLDNANLQRTDLGYSELPAMRGTKLDGARIPHGGGGSSRITAIDCSMRGIQIETRRLIDVSGSDLTGATLKGLLAGKGGRFIKTILRDAKLAEIRADESDFTGADLAGADLPRAYLRGSKAPGACFARANLAGADLSAMDLTGADLSGADLTGASLVRANLTGAKVDGANFKDAAVAGATFDGVDMTKANAFAPPANSSTAGPCIQKLESILPGVKKLESTIRVDLPEGYVVVTISSYGINSPSAHAFYRWQPESIPGAIRDNGNAPTLAGAFAAVGGRWLQGRIRPDTLKVTSQGSPIAGKALKDLFLGAWREALGADAAEAADAAAGKTAPTGKERAAALLDELRGPDGVSKWNARNRAERTPEGGFRGADLTNAVLARADLRDLDFQKAKFDGAVLDRADLRDCKLAGASFAGASLDGANLRGAALRGATFRGARLGTASFLEVDLRSVDFTDAQLADAQLRRATFDETTILPAGFAPPPDMIWKGKSADPRVTAAPATAPGAAIAYPKMDADAFMKSLAARTDKGRMAAALAMLKADRFKLFVEVTDDRLCGIVKSQSDDKLVYAGAIAADGAYACCTQNLNPCGGLRGAPCKHLLVLAIGLATSGGIDPGRADAWITAGRGRMPSLDKDAMARILLRYKGAESGEVDWRPMETVPEDYYAM